MKAVRFDEYGGPDVLHLADVAEPHPQPGQIRIAVRAAGVNAMDWKIREGMFAEFMPISLPAGTGADAAGIVDEVGDGVTDVRVGDAVLGSGSGTYAEHVVLTAWVRKPDKISFEEAAGFPVPVGTAIRILAELDLRTGQMLVVSGAAGGVGSAVVQIAVDRGITVVGTAGAANQSYLTELGAKATTYDDGWVERVRALAPDGVDAAFDIAGAAVIPDLIALTGDPARVLSVADFSAPQFGARVSDGLNEDRAAALLEAVRLVEAGVLTLPVQQTFPLAEAAAAQTASQAGHVRGRLVVTVP